MGVRVCWLRPSASSTPCAAGQPLLRRRVSHDRHTMTPVPPPQLHTVHRPSSELLHRWIQKHADLLAKERAAEQDEARLLRSKCPPKQLERNGLAILGLGVLSVSVGLGGKTLVELERPAAFHTSPVFPPHSLRPGDIVQIEDNSIDASAAQGKTVKSKEKGSTGVEAVSGVVFRVSETRLTVACSSSKGGSNGTDASDLPARVRVIKVANDATYDRMEWTLTKLAKALNVSIKTAKRVYDASSSEEEDAKDTGKAGDGGTQTTAASSSASQSSTLIPSLMGITQPEWSAWPADRDTPDMFNENLNASQVDAIKFAMSAKHFALIHGPPGTGKTTTVAEMVLQWAIVEDKRVLVCGASNLAADNLLERIVAKGGDALKKGHVGVTRLGHPARVLPSLMTATLDYQAQRTSEGALLNDVKRELESALNGLRPKEPAGNKSTSSRGQASAKAQRVRGSERKERREEIKVLRKEFRKRSRGLERGVLKRASIVVATCHGAGGRQLDGIEFDVVVIDEACQATEAACWVPIMKAKPDGKVILAGDHLQLPPTVKSYRHSQHKGRKANESKKNTSADTPEQKPEEDDVKVEDGASESSGDEKEEQYDAAPKRRKTSLRPPRSLETTLFSRLLGMYGQACKALLDTQYRMNEEIMRFPNEALYQGHIKADESCAAIRLHDLESYKTEEDVEIDVNDDAGGAPIVFYDTAGCEMFESQQQTLNGSNGGKASIAFIDSRANAHEVELVAQHVALLVKRGLAPERISVLSPYNLQVSALADRLRGGGQGRRDEPSTSPSLPPLDNIVVGSIDSMQGMENDVIILSLVRSNETRSVGFLAEQRRLNVAMTRAKRQLCIVGDSDTIAGSGDAYLKQWMAFLEQHSLIEPVIV